MMTMKGFHRYCKRVRESGEWGGEPEVSRAQTLSFLFLLLELTFCVSFVGTMCTQILALSRYYQIPIHVVQSNHPKIVAHSPGSSRFPFSSFVLCRTELTSTSSLRPTDPKANATLDAKAAKKIRAVRISYHRCVLLPPSLSSPSSTSRFRSREADFEVGGGLNRRLYGLGEHYNSLRKIQYTMTAFSAMV